MKMRKKLAALLAAAMIASVMPMTAFAASTNRVTNTVTVKKDSVIDGVSTPLLAIDLKDHLKNKSSFYLELENAKWKEDVEGGFEWKNEVVTGAAIGVIKLERVNDTTLAVIADANTDLSTIKELKIALYTKATGGEAFVTIDPATSVVTKGKYLFAVSDDSKAEVKVADAKTFVDQGTAAKITLEESYAGAFNKDENQVIEIELHDDNFSFAKTDKTAVKGLRGFRDVTISDTEIKVKDQKATITIKKDQLENLDQGIFEIDGLAINANRDASEGEVTAYVSAPFVKGTTVTLAKFGDYSTKLTTEKVEEFTAGNKKTVKFKLEQVGAAISKDRSAIFTFPKDIQVLEIKKAGEDKDAPAILLDRDDNKTNEFEVIKFGDVLKNADSNIEFEVEINIPSKFTGDIVVSADGRALDGTNEVKLAEVKAPVTVEVEAMSIKAGTRENKGGKITITETDKQNINRGTLVIQLPKDLKDDGVEFENVKDLVIETTGGIKNGKAKYNSTTSAIEIEITSQSKEVGSIEISGFEVKAKRAIIDGAYEVEIGGKAISSIADLALNADKDGYKKIDAITSADFLLVGNVYARAEVVFNIGSEKFTVNGKEMTMDAQAFIQEGRTMVPLRYLSYALGIDTESIKFNAGIVTIFAEDGRVIQVKNGDRNLAINGMTIPMTAAATIVEGRTYVPVTEIGGVFGVTGRWDSETQTATFK